MTRNQAAFKLAHEVTRRSVADHGGDYRTTFGAVLRDINAQVAANEHGCIAVFLDECGYVEVDAIDNEFVACAIWALEGDIHCVAA